MMLLRIFAVLLIVNTTSGQHHCRSVNSVRAFNAARQCKLATPNYSVQEINYKVDLTEAYDEPLWVGYAEASFAYIGCLDISHPTGKENENSTNGIEANPAACYFHCNSAYIGIEITTKGTNEVKCHCLHQHPNKSLDNTICSNECSFPNNILCGDRKAVSIYQKVTSSVVQYGIIQGPAHCLAYQPSNGSESGYFFWSRCSDGHQRICTDHSGKIFQAMGSNGSWNSAMLGCATNNLLPPSTSTNFSNVSNETSPVWTSIIRSFYTCNTQDLSCGSGANQGYVNDSEKGYYSLQFGFEGALKAMCAVPNDTACTRPTSTTPADRETGGSSTLFTTTTTTASTDDRNTNNNPTTTNPLTSPVVVYIVIPLVLISIAAGTGFSFLWRRRRFLSDKSPGKEPMQNDGTSIDGLGVAISNSAHEDNGAVRHDYFMLEPINEYAAIKDTDIAQASNDDEYDTPSAVHAKANGDLGTGKFYNMLDDVTDDTYNHCKKKTP